MEKTELLRGLEKYREWLLSNRNENPVHIGLSQENVDVLLTNAIYAIHQSKQGLLLSEYQEQAMTTCMESSNNIPYMLLNLVGEVGELSSKIAKHIRKGQLEFNHNQLNHSLDVEQISLMMDELGDILWQASGIASVMAWSLEDVAKSNLKKLADRKTRKVIDGNGDKR